MSWYAELNYFNEFNFISLKVRFSVQIHWKVIVFLIYNYVSKTNEFLLSLEYLHYIKLVGMKLNAYEYIFNNYLSSVKYSEYHIFFNMCVGKLFS